MSDVIVIGGGVIGLLSAWRLAQAGLSVDLFERGALGAESSSAALGVLVPHASTSPPFFNLTQASLKMFPALAAELRDSTGIEIELRDEGMLLCALDDSELESFDETFHVEQIGGVPVRWLSAREARELEPSLSEDVRGAIHYTAALQVDNVRMCRALTLAAARAGAQLHAGQMVTRVARESPRSAQSRNGARVSGVIVSGELHRAPQIVLAAGSWSGSIEGVSLPLEPTKGQALSLDPSTGSGRGAPTVITHILDSAGGYVTPRRDGRLLIGATVEHVGYDKRVTASALLELLAHATRLVPALKDATVRETWAGLRPQSADGLPILGAVANCEGLIAVTGHFRNGILLAPISAQLVTEWTTRKPTSVDASAFSPNRFATTT